MTLADGHRRHGRPPHRVVVVHGGPGAPGSARGIADRLAATCGVVEPFQSADSVDGQIAELAGQIATLADPPVVLIGSSWGAVLAALVTGRHPLLVDRLVMVGSAGFDDAGSAQTKRTRLERLTPANRSLVESVMERMDAGTATLEDLEQLDARLFAIDHVDPITDNVGEIELQPDLNAAVWSDVAAWRADGRLLEMASAIAGPLLVIHGRHDPHPLDSVTGPLGDRLPQMRVVQLADCGHVPWIERRARAEFFALLRSEIDQSAASTSFER